MTFRVFCRLRAPLVLVALVSVLGIGLGSTRAMTALAQESSGRAPGDDSGSRAEPVSKTAETPQFASDSFSRAGVFSLGVAFGSQASPYGREAAGARLGLSQDLWLGAYLQAGRNATTRKRAFGGHLEMGYDLAAVDRARLAVVPIFAYGMSHDEAEDAEVSMWGAALALHLEVFLTRQISTALRIEAGGQWAPEDDLRASTASSEVLLYYHLR